MKNKKNVSIYFAVGAIISVLYIIFAVKPLVQELQFVPEWKIDVTNPTINKTSPDAKTYYFRLGQTMGYFSEDGKVSNFITFPFKASISEDFYTFYAENNSECVLYSKNGEKKGILKGYGFPLIRDDKIFLFAPGGNSVSQLDENGESLWDFESTSPITAFASSKSGAVLGFANGSVTQFDNDGKILQQFSPGGSEIQIISGVAVSSNGEYVATVSGQNKERFVLAKKDGAHLKIIFHEFRDESKPIQKLVKFSDDDSAVYYDFDGILGIIDVKTLNSKKIKIKGQAISLKESEKCAFLLTKSNDEYTVYIIEKNSTLIGSFSFNANTAFIHTDKNTLFIGKDSSISKINILKK